MGRAGQRARAYHSVPSSMLFPSTDRHYRPLNVPSSPPLATALDHDVDSNIPSSQISPTNTIRMARVPDEAEAARLERGRQLEPRVDRQALYTDKLAWKFAVRKAKEAKREAGKGARDEVKVNQQETIKKQVAKLKDFGKNLLGSVRAKVTGVKTPPSKPDTGDGGESRSSTPVGRIIYDSREATANYCHPLRDSPDATFLPGPSSTHSDPYQPRQPSREPEAVQRHLPSTKEIQLRRRQKDIERRRRAKAGAERALWRHRRQIWPERYDGEPTEAEGWVPGPPLGEPDPCASPQDPSNLSGTGLRVDGRYFVGMLESQGVKAVPPSTDATITAVIRRLGITARAAQRIEDGISRPEDEKIKFPTSSTTECNSPAASQYDADASEPSTADDDKYAEGTLLIQKDRKGKNKANPFVINRRKEGDRRDQSSSMFGAGEYTLLEPREQSRSLGDQLLVESIDQANNSLASYTEILPSNFRGDTQTENPGDDQHDDTAHGEEESDEDSDPGDPGDWIPWFQYPDIPGIPLGPRLSLFEYPELKDFRKNWLESRANEATQRPPGRAKMRAKSGDGDTTVVDSNDENAERSRRADRTEITKSEYSFWDTRKLQQPSTIANSSTTANEGPSPGTSRKAMTEYEKTKAQRQDAPASTTQANHDPSNNGGFSSVWDQIGSRPAPSGAASASPRPNKPGSSILSADTAGSYQDNTVPIENHDNMTFAVGNLAPGVTRICLVRDMPGLAEAIADYSLESGTAAERKTASGGAGVDSSPVQDMYGAGPFRNGLMPPQSGGPSNVVRLERNGATFYTTVDAVKQVQREQRYTLGSAGEKSIKEPIPSDSGPEDDSPQVKPVPVVEKKRNRISEWFNRFKDQEPKRVPRVDNSVNTGQFAHSGPSANKVGASLQSKPAMRHTARPNNNTYPGNREPVRPPNSENYTFTPRLPPPSATAFVYRQDDTEEPEDNNASSHDDPPKFASNRFLAIDRITDTTALSDRAKQKLEDATQVAMEQAVVRLLQAQERMEARRQAENDRLEAMRKQFKDDIEFAFEESAIRHARAWARLQARQAGKQTESNPAEATGKSPESVSKGNLAIRSEKAVSNQSYHTTNQAPQVSTSPPTLQPVDCNLLSNPYSPYDTHPSHRGGAAAPCATSIRVTSDEYKQNMEQAIDGGPPGTLEDARALRYRRSQHPRPPIPETLLEEQSKQVRDGRGD